MAAAQTMDTCIPEGDGGDEIQLDGIADHKKNIPDDSKELEITQ